MSDVNFVLELDFFDMGFRGGWNKWREAGEKIPPIEKLLLKNKCGYDFLFNTADRKPYHIVGVPKKLREAVPLKNWIDDQRGPKLRELEEFKDDKGYCSLLYGFSAEETGYEDIVPWHKWDGKEAASSLQRLKEIKEMALEGGFKNELILKLQELIEKGEKFKNLKQEQGVEI